MNLKRIIGVIISTLFLIGAGISQTPTNAVYGILLDNTGSLRPELPAVKAVGKEIVGQASSSGNISIFSFSTVKRDDLTLAEIGVGGAWSRDQRILFDEVESLQTVEGQTALFDAIYSVAEKVDSRANVGQGAPLKKIVIIVSDGQDRKSEVKLKELFTYLEQKNIKVHALGLVSSLSAEGGYVGESPRTRAVNFLKKITKKTGGRLIIPKPEQTVEDAVKALLADESKETK